MPLVLSLYPTSERLPIWVSQATYNFADSENADSLGAVERNAAPFAARERVRPPRRVGNVGKHLAIRRGPGRELRRGRELLSDVHLLQQRASNTQVVHDRLRVTTEKALRGLGHLRTELLGTLHEGIALVGRSRVGTDRLASSETRRLRQRRRTTDHLAKHGNRVEKAPCGWRQTRNSRPSLNQAPGTTRPYSTWRNPPRQVAREHAWD